MAGFNLKEKSRERFFKKELEGVKTENLQNNSGKIVTVGVLTEAEGSFTDKNLKDLQQKLGVQLKNIDTIVFKNYDKKETYQENEFTKKDFGWFGSLKLNRLNEFVKNDYDLLINYGIGENLYLKIITLRSQSKFKVGFANSENQLYHLTIDVVDKDIEVLNFETEKYLKILNKI